MRVAYVSRAPFISGAERSLQVLIRSLDGRGIEPYIVGPAGSGLEPWCRAEGIPYRACPLEFRDKWHPWRWWSSVRTLRDVFRRERIELVHGNQLWSYPAAGAAAGSLGIARICHIRDEATPEAVRWFGSSGVEGVVYISRHISRMMKSAWREVRPAPLRTRTLINPVLLPEPLDPVEENRAILEARRRFGVMSHAGERSPVVLGFAGQIAPVKGLVELIDALGGLADDPRWMLLVAGRDPSHDASHERLCREMIRERGLEDRVRFVGFLEDVGAFFRAVDLVLVPSRVEPLGRVPLEAAAYSRPSLASAVGGLPETIEDGVTGWLVPAGDPDAWRSALRRFIDAPAPETGRNARRWVELVAGPPAYARRILEFYGDVMAEHEAMRRQGEPGAMRRVAT